MGMIYKYEQKQRIPTDTVDWDSSLDVVAGAGDAHDSKIEFILAELLCIPVLEELR